MDQVDNPKAPGLTSVTFVHSHDLNTTLQHTCHSYPDCSVLRVPKQTLINNQQHAICEDPCPNFHLDHIYCDHLNHASLP